MYKAPSVRIPPVAGNAPPPPQAAQLDQPVDAVVLVTVDVVAINTGEDLDTTVRSPNWPEVPRPHVYKLP